MLGVSDVGGISVSNQMTDEDSDVISAEIGVVDTSLLWF